MSSNRVCILWCMATLFCCYPSAAQKVNKSTGNPESLSEWFLATGNWYNDPKLYVRTIGTGRDTVVMLHGGWGGEHSSLIPATHGLEEKYFFVFYDQRGSLRSPFPDSLITFKNHIEDLELLRKALGVRKMKLVGHSMGSILASAYHDKYPAHVKSLTLLAPAPLKIPLPPEYKPLSESNGEKVRALLNRPAVKAELDKLNLSRENPPLSSQEETSKFKINFSSRFLYDVSKWRELSAGGPYYNVNTDQLTSKTMPQSGWDYPANFLKSKIPVSVILGDHDFLDMGGAIVKKWSQNIPSVEVAVIENAGHQIWTDQPEKFRDHLDKALKK